ncbi:MAG: GAF domain-containing sensor histidine kinase [Polyangiaceae bacterium]|nr:GAF domain-containing sensor histidine kinase [Polyangiaceae bacterium]
MPSAFPVLRFARLGRQFQSKGESLGQLWGQRSTWQVRLRWAVPPTILACVAAALHFGYRFEWRPVAGVALTILAYNALIAFASALIRPVRRKRYAVDVALAFVQVCLDYMALLTMLHFTGGVASPLLFFLVFHVIFAAMLFRPVVAYIFAAAAAAGTSLLALVEFANLLPSHPVWYAGKTLTLANRPGHILAVLVFFSGAVFITAAVSNMIVARLREGVVALADANRRANLLNDKLASLYVMVEAVSAQKVLDRVLKTVVEELSKVTEVAGLTVALSKEDGSGLSYAAVHGLAAHFGQDPALARSLSAFSDRAMRGEAVVVGKLADGVDAEPNGTSLRLPDELAPTGIRSVILAPLTVGGRSIGVLGAYRRAADPFREEDIDFFRLAGELVGIAIDDARQAEAIERLMQERTRLMLQVGHNLRAPLSAASTMLETIVGSYLGSVSPKQAEYLQRIGRRLDSMQRTIAEMLALARAQRAEPIPANSAVALSEVVSEVASLFRPEAERKPLELRVECPPDLPSVRGDAELLNQLVENLLSNSIKYTPAGGTVTVSVALSGSEELTLDVSDTGIGIPPAEQDRLFTEFFRASNARRMQELGTGLGLPIVKRIAERHGGTVQLHSELDKGTRVLVTLPVARPETAENTQPS